VLGVEIVDAQSDMLEGRRLRFARICAIGRRLGRLPGTVSLSRLAMVIIRGYRRLRT
jgi:hypothetical protein